MTTPICMMSLRLSRSDNAEAVKPPTTTRNVGPATSQRISSPERPRAFGEHDQRAAQGQVIAFNEADSTQHHDQKQVVGTEGNAVEFLSE
jgi:hypothetical protein